MVGRTRPFKQRELNEVGNVRETQRIALGPSQGPERFEIDVVGRSGGVFARAGFCQNCLVTRLILTVIEHGLSWMD
jgi:hypothetical protein